MTEKKKVPGQTTLYHYRTGPARAGRHTHRLEMSRSKKGRVRQPSYALGRVVTVPQADPSLAWHDFEQRQQRMRHERARPPKRVVYASRTLAQTGTRAQSGRLNIVRPPLPYHQSPVPRRSGQLRARHSLLGRVLSFFAISAVLALVLGFTLTSSAFRIEQVNVTGTHNDALIRTVQGMGMQGQNIFLLDVPILKERVGTASPLVASVDISKQWPNQVTVTVVERTPALLWRTSQGTYSVDQRGVVIAPMSDTVGSRLGTVIDVTPQSHGKASGLLRPGQQLDPGMIGFALSVFQRLPQVTGIHQFELHYDGTMYASQSVQLGGGSGVQASKGAYIVKSPDGWQAYLGGEADPNPLDNRLIELREILNLVQKQQIAVSTIDLRYGLRPVIVPVKSNA